MLILKQNSANSVPTPPAGKGTIFLDDSNTLSIKIDTGNVENFPTVGASNTQVIFMDGTNLSGDADFTWDKNTNVLTINGNIAAGNVKTDNLLYANGQPWDLQQPGGSNTQVQFNDADQFGGSANYVFNKTTNNLTVTGNIIDASGAFYGSGAGLTNIPGANVSGEVGYAAVANSVAGANVSGQVGNALVAGTVYTAAQPNITSVGTLSSLAVTANITAGNVYANSGAIGASLLTGTLTTASQPNITSVGTLSSITATGNGTFGNVYANSGTIGAGTLKGEGGNISNIQGANVSGAVAYATTANAVAGANVSGAVAYATTANAVAGANVSGQVGNALVAGTVYTAAQPNITSVGTLSSLSVTGTASAGHLSGEAGNISNVQGANVSGTVSSATTAATVTTAAQPNITSVGTLSSLTVTGNITSGNIDGGNLVKGNYVQGTLTTASQPNITSVGTLSSVTVTANGTFGNVYANSGIIEAQTLKGEGGNISNIQAANVSGTVATATTAGTVTTAAQPNITSVGTLSSLAVTANGTFGNVYANSGIVGAAHFTGEAGNLSNITAGNITGQVANALVAGTVYTAAQPNITSVGTLTSLGVNGTVTAVNITANTGVFTGNGAALTNLTGANVTGQVGNALVAGTVYTAAQPNITSVGTLSSLTVTANGTFGNVYANSGTIEALTLKGEGGNISNITAGNITGQVGNALVAGTVYTAAQPNITSVGTLTSATVTGNVAAGNLTTTGILSVTGTSQSNIAGNLSMTSKNIINLAEPVNATDAATKNYVDAAVTGLHVHAACYVATTGTLATASGGTTSYNVPGPGQVGAYISTTGTFNLIDGGNVQTVGTRILVKNEANAVWNGIYTYANTTALVRATDFDTSADAAGGDFTFIQTGTVNADTGWVQTTDNPVLGTDNIVFTQFSGAGTYSAGTGLTLSGTTFSITNTAVSAGSYGNGDRVASFTVNAQGQLTAASNVVIAANAANLTGTTLNSGVVTSSLTSVGTLGSLTVTANGTFGNVYANSGIIGALTLKGEGGNISNITAGNITGQVANALVAGTVYTAAQPNITSVGTLSSLDVTANGTFGNVYANSGTIGALTLKGEAGNLSNITGGNVSGQVGNALVAGTVYTAAQPNITSVGTLSSLAVTANGTFGNVYANAGIIGAQTLKGDGGNISNVTAGNITGQVANALVAGTVYTAAQPNITSVGTLSSLAVTANGTFGNVYANAGIIGAQTLKGEGGNISNIQGANVSGTVSSATTAGTVTTAAQPNITSVGTLTSLAVTGNTTVGNLIGPHANGNSNVNIPSANGNVNISAVGVANVLVITGTGVNVAGTLNATGNANVGNIGATNGVFTNVSGNGDGLSSIQGTNVTGTLNSTTLGNSTLYVGTTAIALNRGSASQSLTGITSIDGYASTVSTAAQPNITSVGTLTGLTVNGVTNLGGNGNVIITGGSSGQVLSTNGSGNLSWISNAAHNHAQITSGTSNVVVNNSANVTVSVAGTANVLVVTSTGANIAGTLNATGNANVGNIGAAAGVFTGTVSGTFSGDGSALTTLNASNISSGTLAQARLANSSLTVNGTSISLGGSGTITANGSQNLTFNNGGAGDASGTTYNGGTAKTISYNTVGAPSTTGTNASGSWGISVTGSAGTAGTVTTAAQPNITSVGTLTSLTVSGAANVQSSTAATSTTTGALIVAGGIGTGGNSYMSNMTVKSNIAYVSPNGANTINSQMLNGGTLSWSGNAGQLFSITDSMTGNIFSVNDVSGIPMITVDTTGTINLAPSGGFVAFGVSTGISAAGSTQGTATLLTRPINVVSTVSASQGVILPTTTPGMRIVVMNTSGTALNVYPASGGAINSGSTNAAFSLAAGGRLEFISTSTTQWYTLNATYA